jgi:hypothetical protein
MKDMLIEVGEAKEAKGQFLTAKELVIVLQESLEEAVKDMPEADRAEAKLASLQMFQSAGITA